MADPPPRVAPGLLFDQMPPIRPAPARAPAETRYLPASSWTSGAIVSIERAGIV